MEYLSLYTKDLEPVPGRQVKRGERAPAGLFVLASRALVVHADGTYLAMQRAPGKTAALQWELSAGGCAHGGEGPEECIVRELSEETGLHGGTLRSLGRYFTEDGGGIFVDYLYETDCPKDCITLQPGETSAYRWISQDELLAMQDDPMLTEGIKRYIKSLADSRPSGGCFLPDAADGAKTSVKGSGTDRTY